MNPSSRGEPGEKASLKLKAFKPAFLQGCDGALHVLKQIP